MRELDILEIEEYQRWASQHGRLPRDKTPEQMVSDCLDTMIVLKDRIRAATRELED